MCKWASCLQFNCTWKQHFVLLAYVFGKVLYAERSVHSNCQLVKDRSKNNNKWIKKWDHCLKQDPFTAPTKYFSPELNSAAHLQALLSETLQLCLMAVMLILQVALSLSGLAAQSLYLQHQDLPLPGQHQQLPLGAVCLPGGRDESPEKNKKSVCKRSGFHGPPRVPPCFNSDWLSIPGWERSQTDVKQPRFSLSHRFLSQVLLHLLHLLLN